MAIAALTYISVSALLILGAIVFFKKALQSLSQQDNSSNLDHSPDYPSARTEWTATELKQSVLTAKREEIIEMLERQFHSSP
jgi:hypothetical protein